MQNAILCEGSTDYALLQYFMKETYGWKDTKKKNLQSDSNFNKARTLKLNDNTLTIAGVGGCSRILPCLSRLFEINSIASNDEESYHKIAMIIDRDEIETEREFIETLHRCMNESAIKIDCEIEHDKWLECTYTNGRGKECKLFLIFLIIPFETTGAMETFLLNAISNQDRYDAEIIKSCNEFVDEIDPEKRYLNKRRYVTKAKFDVYFSVRTAAEQFSERQELLKRAKWEEYTYIQESFQKLEELAK